MTYHFTPSCLPSFTILTADLRLRGGFVGAALAFHYSDQHLRECSPAVVLEDRNRAPDLFHSPNIELVDGRRS